MPRPILKLHPLVLLRVVALSGASLFLACGVEVGNPGKPRTGAATPELSEGAKKEQNLLRLVEGQYDEAMIASLENYALFDLGQATSLEGNGQAKGQSEKAKNVSKKGRSCSDEVAGAVTLKRELKGSVDQTLDKTQVTDRYERNYEARLIMQDAVSACKSDKSGASVDWSQVSGLQLEAKVERKLERSTASAASPETEVKSRITASSIQKAKIERLSLDSAGLKLAKTLEIASEVASEHPLGANPIKTLIATLKEKPLVVQETYNAASQIESITIARGSLTSEQADGTKIQLDYDNVALDGSGSCQPLSGSISGTILAGLTPGLTFKLAFDGSKAELVYEDGQRTQLTLERCQLDDAPENESESQSTSADARGAQEGKGKGQGQGQPKGKE